MANGSTSARIWRGSAHGILAVGLLASPVGGSWAQTPPLAIEESDTAVLPPAGPRRVIALPSLQGGSGAVIDGEAGQLNVLGTIPMPGNAALALSRDASRILVSETYWSHGNRGDRADLLSIYDGRTLDLLREIPLPGRLLVTAKLGQLGMSSDDALAYVYAFMPSSQAHVVDLASGKLLASVDIPGCALIYPYGPRSFGTICGDGTVGAATLPATGEAKIAFSQKFFDADRDPIFENSLVDRETGDAWLLSFSGRIYPARFGTTPVVDKPWSITVAAGLPEAGDGVQELTWRPGGGQLMAMHRPSRRLFILMHPGNYWTHKSAGTEVWVLDSAKHTLLRRIPLDKPAKNIIVTQDEMPRLFAFGGDDASFSSYDAETGKKLAERRLSSQLGLVAEQ